MDTDTDLLVCPETKLRLRHMPLLQAELEVCGGRTFGSPHAVGYAPIGPTPELLVRADGLAAYPIRQGIPILLGPEMLVPPGVLRAVDVRAVEYAEAYEEMAHYDHASELEAHSVATSTSMQDLGPLCRLTESQRRGFPEPRDKWLDAKYELAAQWDAFRHLRPITGARVLQIGGKGLHAVKFLLAGADEAWVASPMLGELLFAQALARHCGVEDRLRCVAAVAEELPFRESAFDAIYSQGCVHHWKISEAMPECSRVLVSRGRFAAVEPWRGPLYGLGIKIFGKRDPGVQCQVLTAPRIEPHLGAFLTTDITHHGAISRYPLLALRRVGLRLTRAAVWNIGRWDDAIGSLLPSLREKGSSVAILAIAR
jgi:uncharacterized protein YbaR (Trm112 family)